MTFVTGAAYSITRAMRADAQELLRFGVTPWSRTHTSLALHRVGQAVMSYDSQQFVLDTVLHKRQLDALKLARSQQSETKKLITNTIEKKEQNYGYVRLDGGNFSAIDINGNKVPEALFLYYKGEQDIQVRDNQGVDRITKYVCFIDTAPEISMGTTKNLLMTPVQGRDYSRKELISGGDLKFSISGNVVSHIPDMYPENDVKKLINIAEYGGIVEVNNMIFDQFNVNKILINDFQLGKQQYKNIQPYTLSCVAVEPDTDVVIVSDTIDMINYNIQKQNRNTIDDLALMMKVSGRVVNLNNGLSDIIRVIGGGQI